MTKLSVDEKAGLSSAARRACTRWEDESSSGAATTDEGVSDPDFGLPLWNVLCHQVGVASIGIPEALGGAGHGVAAQAIVGHELGRVLAPVPYLASAVLATELLVAGEAPADLIASLASGDVTAAAVLSTQHKFSRKRHPIAAWRRNSGWTLNGTAQHVLHGAIADYLVVAADVGSETAIFLVSTLEQGVSVDSENVLDRTRPMATVTFTKAPAHRLAPRRSGRGLIDRCLQRALAVLSAEQVGACERLLELATEYARNREQFGRPIGSFQAVKHRCTNMLVELEMARSASMAAVQAVSDGSPEASWRANMAKAVCSEALRECAHANLQIHGGIGFTAEHSAGKFVKRARTDEVLFGPPGEHWDRLATKARLFA